MRAGDMPSGGRAVSLSVGCLSWSLSFGDAAFCAVTTAAVAMKDARVVNARTRSRRCFTIPFVHSTANEGSSDNGEMVYSRLPLPVVDADVVVVPWFEDDSAASMPDVDAATRGELKRAL